MTEPAHRSGPPAPTGPVVVTGACGLVGRHTVGRLLAEGRDVVAVDLDSPVTAKVRKRWRGNPLFRFRPCDLTDADAVRALLADVEPAAVVHLAAIIPPVCYARPELARKVNVEATRFLVEAAAALARPPRFVHASSVAVHGARNPHRVEGLLSAETPMAPTDLYGELKAAAEESVRGSRLEWVVLRLGGVITTDNDTSLNFDMLHFESLLPSDNRIQTVDVRDVAFAFVAATTAAVAGEILMIGGDDATHRLRQHQVASGITDAMGLIGALPAGKPGDPDDDRTWFATDWMDTTRAQQALGFQRHSWPQMLEEVARDNRRVRPILVKAAPLLNRVVTRSNAKRGTARPF